MNDVIAYTKKKIITEKFNIIVENKRHCFFEGASAYNGRTEYIGLYISDNRQKIIFIGEDKTIKILTDLQSCGGQVLDIKTFHENHESCRQITSERFFTELKLRISWLGLDTLNVEN